MIRTPTIEEREGDFSDVITFRVRFGDTDAAGIVYYANYLRYFEAGRAELMRSAGLPYASVIAEHGVVMPVVETWCRYRAPARYDDLLTMRSWVHEIRSASLLIGTRIHRDDVLLVEGGVRMGCMSLEGQIRRLPEAIRDFAEQKA